MRGGIGLVEAWFRGGRLKVCCHGEILLRGDGGPLCGRAAVPLEDAFFEVRRVCLVFCKIGGCVRSLGEGFFPAGAGERLVTCGLFRLLQASVVFRWKCNNCRLLRLLHRSVKFLPRPVALRHTLQPSLPIHKAALPFIPHFMLEKVCPFSIVSWKANIMLLV